MRGAGGVSDLARHGPGELSCWGTSGLELCTKQAARAGSPSLGRAAARQGQVWGLRDPLPRRVREAMGLSWVGRSNNFRLTWKLMQSCHDLGTCRTNQRVQEVGEP